MTKFEDNLSPYLSYVEGSAPSSPAAGNQRVFIDSADHHLKVKNSGGTVTDIQAGGAALASASYKRTAGDYTTTSNTFVDVDGTNLALTIVTGAHRVLVTVICSVYNSSSADYIELDVDLDGTRLGNASKGFLWFKSSPGNEPMNGSFSILTDALTAASHTFKLQWRRDSTGTVTMYGGSSSLQYMKFAVVELNA